MNIDSDKRKMLRLLCFLLSALLVTTASAAVYNYMHLQASPIGAETPYVRFVSGNDATSTFGANDTWAKITTMAGWPNATRVYEDALRIQNLDGNPHNCELMFDSWSGNTDNITCIYVKIFNSVGGTQQGSTLSVTTGNSTGSFNLPATTTYYVQWEITWDAGALSTYTVDVALKLKVEA